MTPEQAAALRAPFAPKSIGKLPKGGAMLDYVGHAVTTDRLLTVDPEWTWEPVAFDVNGLPAVTGNGCLWIRLTVCGVTRYGVGDGKSLKEMIGDAIRNAAMRFGVALDLWSKEEAEQANGPAVRPATAPSPVAPPAAPSAPDGDDSGPRTAAQSTALHAAFGAAGIKDRDVALDYCVQIIGRQIDSTKDLTKREASDVLNALAQDTTDAESGA